MSGPPKPRLARQLLFEDGLIAAGAAALGLGLSALVPAAGRAGIEARMGLTVPGGAEALSLDGTVLAGTLALTVVVGLVFGTVPLLSALPKALRLDGRRVPRRDRIAGAPPGPKRHGRR